MSSSFNDANDIPEDENTLDDPTNINDPISDVPVQDPVADPSLDNQVDPRDPNGDLQTGPNSNDPDALPDDSDDDDDDSDNSDSDDDSDDDDDDSDDDSDDSDAPNIPGQIPQGANVGTASEQDTFVHQALLYTARALSELASHVSNLESNYAPLATQLKSFLAGFMGQLETVWQNNGVNAQSDQINVEDVSVSSRNVI